MKVEYLISRSFTYLYRPTKTNKYIIWKKSMNRYVVLKRVQTLSINNKYWIYLYLFISEVHLNILCLLYFYIWLEFCLYALIYKHIYIFTCCWVLIYTWDEISLLLLVMWLWFLSEDRSYILLRYISQFYFFAFIPSPGTQNFIFKS